MGESRQQRFTLGDWLVDPVTGLICSGDKEVTIRPREMDLLVYLARRTDTVVTTDNLIENVWKGVFVTNDSVYFSVSQLRKALGDDSHNSTYIETIPKRGYRLIAPVQFSGVTEETSSKGAVPGGNDGSIPVSAGNATADEMIAETESATGVLNFPDQFFSGSKAVKGWLRGLIGLTLVVMVLWKILAPTGDTGSPVAVPTLIAPPSIAVMPFVDLSPNGDQEYFSDGIAEELLNILSRVEGLRVAARTSSFAFKSKEPSVQEIGRALGVATILEGSVRKEGNRVKIAVQLVDTNDGFFIWSQSYQRELSSILTVQDEIGRSIAKALEIELIGEQGTGSPATKRAAIPLAYDQYLKGLAAFRRNSFEALEESVEHFETVIRLDPLFAQAYNALARSKLVQLATGSVTDKDQLAQAESLALKALAIDPDDGAPHTTLGEIYRQKGLSKESQQQYLEALRLSPNNIQAMVALASTYNTIDQRQQALDLFQQALRADPFNPDVHMKYGHILIQLGQTEQALKSFDWAVEQSPQNPNYRWMIGGLMLRETGDISSAIQHMQAAARLDPDDYEIQAFVGMSYLVLEAVDQAKPYIDRALLVNQNSSIVQTALAYYLLLTGQKDKALQVSMETLLDENMRFTQGTAYDLMGIAVNELLERGDISAAENLVSETNPNYSTFLRTTGISPFTQNMINGMAKEWVLARANVFKAAGQISALEGELDLLQPAGLASTSNFRERLLSSDYLTEAEIRALRDDEEGALEMLEKAVAKGFRYTWHITIANNYAFKRLRNHERFKALLQRIRKDLDVQLALLDSV